MVRTISRPYVAVFTLMASMALMLTLPSLASAAPSNDNFADAQEISGQAVSVNGTNVDATTEDGEPIFNGTRSLWYRWTAPAEGTVTMTTCDSGSSILLSVYTGNSLGSLTQVRTDALT